MYLSRLKRNTCIHTASVFFKEHIKVNVFPFIVAKSINKLFKQEIQYNLWGQQKEL